MGINKSGRRPTKLGKRGKGRITMVALNNTASSSVSNVHMPFRYKLHFIQIIFRDEKKFSLDGPD
uniref:Ovule protein n=1 Tax=Heterorhabditis bacteriophora TaxID=37862 RepID=A0A1I7XSX0_HETBA